MIRDNKEGIEARVPVKKRKNTSIDSFFNRVSFLLASLPSPPPLPFLVPPLSHKRTHAHTIGLLHVSRHTVASYRAHTFARGRGRFVHVYTRGRVRFPRQPVAACGERDAFNKYLPWSGDGPPAFHPRYKCACSQPPVFQLARLLYARGPRESPCHRNSPATFPRRAKGGRCVKPSLLSP